MYNRLSQFIVYKRLSYFYFYNKYTQVIEAVYEDLKLKKEIFEKIDRICNPHAILCTNTSTLEIDLVSWTHIVKPVLSSHSKKTKT